MKFIGDIIITDPCYIIKKHESNPRPNIYTNEILKNLGSVQFTKYTPEQMEEYKKLEAEQAEWDKNNPDDWEVCEYGDRMGKLGLTRYLTSYTEYGDWSCTTYEEGTKKKLGEFCADAGLVSVFLLEEVLKYNPEFDYHINNKHTTTWIKDFDGDVEITHRNDEVSVVGTGNVNFFTSQTGF